MRPLIFPYSRTLFPTYRSFSRAFQRTLARASGSWMLLGNPQLMSLGIRAYFSTKLSHSAVQFLTVTLPDWLR